MSFRLFKTKRFALQASRAWISDEELQEAFHQCFRDRRTILAEAFGRND
ncbi:hypothetical protein M2426_001597 [Pseudomonas moraviensis]